MASSAPPLRDEINNRNRNGGNDEGSDDVARVVNVSSDASPTHEYGDDEEKDSNAPRVEQHREGQERSQESVIRREAIVGRVRNQRSEVVCHKGARVVVEMTSNECQHPGEDPSGDQLPAEGDFDTRFCAQPVKSNNHDADDEEVLANEDDERVHSSSVRVAIAPLQVGVDLTRLGLTYPVMIGTSWRSIVFLAMGRVWIVIDALVVLIFVIIGRSNHHHGLAIAGVISTAWPFVVGLAAGWLYVVLRKQNGSSIQSAVVVWLCTVAIGMVLRVLFGQGTAFAFILVALGFLGALMLGLRVVWRARHWRQHKTA
jgi:hypothetical protein